MTVSEDRLDCINSFKKAVIYHSLYRKSSRYNSVGRNYVTVNSFTDTYVHPVILD